MDQAQVVATLLAALAAMGGTIGLVVKALLTRDERQSERENARTDRVMTTLETTISGNHAAMDLNRSAFQEMIRSVTTALQDVSKTLTEVQVLIRDGRALDRQEHQAIVDAQFTSAEKFLGAVERMEKSNADAIGKASRREP